MNETEYWALIHAERARLADLLDGLSAEQWRAGSWCADWTAEQVAAHLTAVASTGTWAWIRSIVRAGFNADRHNARQLARRLGASPAETLERYRASMTNTIAPVNAYAALLGEAVVHGRDIAGPLGLGLDPDSAALRRVARFFASKDFSVNSRTLVKGLALRADDADFETGEGPLVHGRLIDLVMAMAGRPQAAAELQGDGADELRRRLG